jgi:hypothetical protein
MFNKPLSKLVVLRSGPPKNDKTPVKSGVFYFIRPLLDLFLRSTGKEFE